MISISIRYSPPSWPTPSIPSLEKNSSIPSLERPTSLPSLGSMLRNNCEIQTLPSPCHPNYFVSTANGKKWFLLGLSHSQLKHLGQKAQATHHCCSLSTRPLPSIFSGCHMNSTELQPFLLCILTSSDFPGYMKELNTSILWWTFFFSNSKQVPPVLAFVRLKTLRQICPLSHDRTWAPELFIYSPVSGTTIVF